MRQKFYILVFLLFVLIGNAAQQQKQQQHADIILANAKVWTADEKSPQVEAVAIKNDRILFAGTSQTAKRFRSEKTQFLDLGGKLVLPGFIDSHIHMAGRYAKRFSRPLLRCNKKNQRWLSSERVAAPARG